MALKHPWHWPHDTRVGASFGGPHYFSRVGYGNVQIPEDLSHIGNRVRYGLQSLLLDTKKTGGKVARGLLSGDAVRRLRRALKV
jgi:hypothetical protein